MAAVLETYLFFAVAGLGWAVGSFALGKLFGHGDGDGGGAEADLEVSHELGEGGHGEASGSGEGGPVSLPLFSPTAISGYATGFGGTGLILVGGLGITDPWHHVPGALAGAAALGLATAWTTVKLLHAGETSSEGQLASMPGRTGELTVGIPAGGLGEIAYLAGGVRSTAAARTPDGAAVPRGAKVRVVRVEGATFVVAPLELPPPESTG